MSQKTIDNFNKLQKSVLNDLCELVKIPSVSFPEFDHSALDQSARATASLMKSYGLENVELLKIDGAFPYIYGDWLHAPGKPTVLLYAHHDVQPPGREEVWKSKPFEPTLKGDRLFARGAADDKAGILANLSAIRAYLSGGESLPVNVKVIIEGEEEIGSPHLSEFLKRYQKKLAADVMVLSDAGNFDVGLPSLTVSLRGLVSFRLEVRSLKGSLHSGMWGGPLPDPTMALCKMLSQLADDQGRLNIPSLRGKVPAVTNEQNRSLEALPYEESEFRDQAGLLDSVKLIGGDGHNLGKIWYQPSVAINAIEASSKRNSGNIICDVAWAKVGLRIVLPLEPQETMDAVAAYLKSIAPWGVDVKIEPESIGEGWSTTPVGPVFEKALLALEKGFGKKPVLIGCGGSIPFVNPFSEALGGAIPLLWGVEDPRTNAHGENESLHVEDFYKACRSLIYLFEELAGL